MFSTLNPLKLVIEIKTNPQQTPDEIYASLDFSKAAFYKYKKILAREMGFEFAYSRKDHRFRILKDRFIPIDLPLAELSALVASMGQLYTVGGDYIVTYHALNAVRKIVAEYPEKKIRDHLETILSQTIENQGYGCHEQILKTIEKACESQQSIWVRYYSASSQVVEGLKLDPYMIFFKRRALYLDAFCHKHREMRTFRLSRMQTAEILPNTPFTIQEYSFKKRHQHAFSVFGGHAPQKVRLRFSPQVAPYIAEVRWHSSQKITPDPVHRGGILFEVDVAYPKEVIWWMRQWEGEGEVLEPKEMREYAREIAQKEVEMYR